MTKPYYQDESVTLYHGDCREQTAWLGADVLVTDPPYGMAFDSGRVAGRTRPIANDADTTTRDTVRDLWGEAKPWLMFGTWRLPRPRGTEQVLVWDKTDGTGPGMGDLSSAFGTSHEDIYLGGDWTKRAARRGSVLRTAVAMGNPSGLVARTGHPTPKPLSLMETLVAASIGVVADPFAGSGSTLVAAKQLGRKAIGVELEERYCEVIAKRLAQGVLDFGDAS
jgi:hypothetical protein